MVHPILDKYYERDPYHVRSSAFVQAQGLVSNEKPPGGPISPAQETPQPNLDGYRKMLAPSSGQNSELSRRSLTPASTRELHHSAGHLAPASHPRPLPAQGNIKVKRASAHIGGGTQETDTTFDEGHSDNDEPAAADVRNPRKLSRYFPELALASSS